MRKRRGKGYHRDNFTDEETKWLIYVGHWRVRENRGRPPFLSQVLILAKRFLKEVKK